MPNIHTITKEKTITNVDLNDYKKNLIIYIISYLKDHNKITDNIKRPVIILENLSDTSKYFILDIDNNNYYETERRLGNYDFELRNELITYISPLIIAIIEEENYAYNLWFKTEDFIRKMPGWWSFFSPLRSLTLALQALQKSYNPHDLKSSDDYFMSLLIDKLKVEIIELKDKVEFLKSENSNLEQKIIEIKDDLADGNISKDEASRILKERIEHLEEENRELAVLVKQLTDQLWMLTQDKEETSTENRKQFSQLDGEIRSMGNALHEAGRKIAVSKEAIQREQKPANVHQINAQYRMFQNANQVKSSSPKTGAFKQKVFSDNASRGRETLSLA